MLYDYSMALAMIQTKTTKTFFYIFYVRPKTVSKQRNSRDSASDGPEGILV